MIGRFWRSLKVGRITEYVSLLPVFLAILQKVLEDVERMEGKGALRICQRGTRVGRRKGKLLDVEV